MRNYSNSIRSPPPLSAESSSAAPNPPTLHEISWISSSTSRAGKQLQLNGSVRSGDSLSPPPDAQSAQPTRVINFLIETASHRSRHRRSQKWCLNDSLFEPSEAALSLPASDPRSCTEPLLLSTQRILAVAAIPQCLPISTRAIEIFTALFPLVVSAAFGLECDVCATAIVAISQRTGAPRFYPTI
jgi:hypothetical protein